MISHSTSIRTEHSDDELELPVEVVAERLGLPAAMLIRRIEAGDIPARRVEDVDGLHYHVRIADLGPTRAVLPADEETQEITGTAEPVIRNGHGPHAAVVPELAEEIPADAEVPTELVMTDADETDDSTDELQAELDLGGVELAPEEIAEALPPPPVRVAAELASLEVPTEGPGAELTMMALDPRELVAGLLDRWERTLEQRIYAEQRQRFEAELTNRQAKVKHLQLELDAVRAEHAAALAEKERQLAERYRELSEREREVSILRMQEPRRGWFRRR
jgi:hypothetical protein